jgi:hypothetical protein
LVIGSRESGNVHDTSRSTQFNSVTTREADSFAFCDDAFAALTDASAAEILTGGRGGPRAKGIVLNQIIEYDNEMYGIGTVYQRLKGIVPRLLSNSSSREVLVAGEITNHSGGRAERIASRPGRAEVVGADDLDLPAKLAQELLELGRQAEVV